MRLMDKREAYRGQRQYRSAMFGLGNNLRFELRSCEDEWHGERVVIREGSICLSNSVEGPGFLQLPKF